MSVIKDKIISLWNYLSLKDKPGPSEAIFVFGRDDFNISKKALEVYQSGLSPFLVLLGGRGRMTGKIKTSESEAFEKYLLKQNVPQEDILKESLSTNTKENMVEGLRLLKKNSIVAKRVILITHAPHSRRVLAVAKANSNGIDFFSCPDDCSPPLPDSPNWVDGVKELVGEITRLVEYPQLGYFAHQNVPQEIIDLALELDQWLNEKEGDVS